jgi:hypothetical protein
MNAYFALMSLLGLFGLWVVVYYLWPDFRNDAFREDIFSVRDEMFEYASRGSVSFDHPAYTLLRSRMNALLRHGHNLTLTRLVVINATIRDAKSEMFGAWRAAVEQLPITTQEALNDFDLRTTIFVFQHVIYASLFRYLLLRPFMFFIRIRVIANYATVTSSVEQLESATIEEESLVSEPVTA